MGRYKIEFYEGSLAIWVRIYALKSHFFRTIFSENIIEPQFAHKSCQFEYENI